MIRNIVFDMGMVLMDYHPMEACLAEAGNEADAQKLYDALFGHPEWVRMDDGSMEQEELSARSQARLDDPALRRMIPRLLDGMPYNVLTPIPGMADVVDRAFAEGYRVYLLSNANHSVSDHREIIPHIARFDGVVFSVDEKLVKPDPAIYRLLTDRYGLTPAECFFIDDCPENVEAAEHAGWLAFRFTGDIPALRGALAALRTDAAGR
jgi:putative hydrolase of the HAD superfamily